MKRVCLLLLCLPVLLLSAACTDPSANDTSDPSSLSESTTSTAESSAPETSDSSADETTAESSEPEPSPEPSPEPTSETETTQATTAETTTAAVVSPTNTLPMFSSYALMVSYDPAWGWADFDYFNMLIGEEAVQWFVEREGYSLADAEALVADFADSEFIMENDDLSLRTIDLRSIDLKLMFHPDGTLVEGMIAIDAELSDLYDLYHTDPDLLLNSFFYYVTVVDDEVVMVEQVYWP